MIQRKASIRMRALCLAILLACSAVCGCRGVDRGEVVRENEYSLTPTPDVSGLGGKTDVALGLTAKEAEPLGDFSLALMQGAIEQAHRQGAENPVLSPVSAYLALLLAAMGSKGETKTEFENVLGLPADEWGRYGGRLMRFMNQSGGSERLMAANALWLDEGVQIEDAYLERVANELYSEVFRLDLSSKEAQRAVNQWVEERTNGMIPDFRNEPYGEAIRLALLNAVYLEAQWEDAFQRNYTDAMPFYRADKSEVTAQFLCDRPCRREYIKDETVEGVVLPYQSGRLAFLALRATDGRTPEELLAELSMEKLRGLAAGAVETDLDFAMPRFTAEYDMGLLQVLEGLGLLKALRPEEADFYAMTGTGGEPVYISDVNQKVKIQVDEEGTKAAAVTEVTMAGGAAEETQLVQLYLDSPFLYAVMERDTGIILFMGILEDPSKAK